MSPKHIIELDRDGGTYYTGEAIRGKVKIISDPSEDKKINWFGSSIILVEQQIICSLERLWFYPCCYDEQNRCYDFTLHIPNAFYSTCITNCGKHSYYLKASLNYKDGERLKDLITYKDIIIVRPLDLQLYDYIYNVDWEINCNPYIKCQLNHGAYVPGQNVHFEIKILKKMRWKHIKVSIRQIINTERNHHDELIDSSTICAKTFKKGQCFRGLLKLPKGIALSSNYPIYRRLNLFYFRVVSVEYFVRISLCRKFLKTIHLDGKELIVGTKPLRIDEEEEVELDYNMEDPSNFCLQGDPKMVSYAYIPKAGTTLNYQTRCFGSNGK